MKIYPDGNGMRPPQSELDDITSYSWTLDGLVFRSTPAMVAVVQNAWKAGLHTELKLDLAPNPAIANKVYDIKISSSRLKPGQ